MDPDEMLTVPCCPLDSTTGLETGAPWGIEFGPRRAIRRCARCHNHGITGQIKDQEHLCLFQACECHKCVLFSEHCSILPAESALKTMQELHLKRQLTQGLIKSGTTSPKAHSHVKKSSIQTGVLSKLPRCSADRSGIGIFVSVLDSSTLEEATNNFTFQEVTEAPCPAQQAPKTSDQDSDSASLEWQRKLEAAEALLTLRESSQAPSGPTPLLQPSAAPAPAGERGLQPPSRSLRPRPASSISLPIGHVGCISLLS
ncbi:doublesex- and mab-3-related transcription factor 3-like [Phacochoerus africanus]|uniref:doublesex- and mab-3-related transcription factor 3-like n=1 Tax=Phacochoerus africanus TaxID=41426 RepID=UPI001FDAC5D6|nr:doublesex- and mab-3-related transcription factor 3-like [Phacochoerus africanus]